MPVVLCRERGAVAVSGWTRLGRLHIGVRFVFVGGIWVPSSPASRPGRAGPPDDHR